MRMRVPVCICVVASSMDIVLGYIVLSSHGSVYIYIYIYSLARSIRSVFSAIIYSISGVFFISVWFSCRCLTQLVHLL